MEPEYYYKPRNHTDYPIRRASELKADQTYRARNGQRIRIYVKEQHELHGAILIGGKWQIDTWNLDGSYMDGGKEHDRDIVIQPTLSLEPNKLYKTRDGRQAKVIYINKGCVSDPIVGFIQEKDGYWYHRSWNNEGHVKRPYWPNNDIVAEWSSA